MYNFIVNNKGNIVLTSKNSAPLWSNMLDLWFLQLHKHVKQGSMIFSRVAYIFDHLEHNHMFSRCLSIIMNCKCLTICYSNLYVMLIRCAIKLSLHFYIIVLIIRWLFSSITTTCRFQGCCPRRKCFIKPKKFTILLYQRLKNASLPHLLLSFQTSLLHSCPYILPKSDGV